MNNPYLIKFQDTVQIGPDDWKVLYQEGLFEETATLKEIHEWIMGVKRVSDKNKLRLQDVELSQPMIINKEK